MTGREILATLFDGTFDILQGASYLHDTAVLVSAGLVVPDMSAEGDEDALETRFRLSRRVYRLILDEFTPAPAKEPRSRSKRDDKGYRNNSGHLLDLKRLSLLYRKRASKVFGLDYWEELGVCAAESVTRLNRQIREQRRRIEERVAKTARPEKLHAMKLFARHNLREEEVVILVTLLFQEFLEGDPYLPSSDLLKLVAQSDEDLLGKRGIFSKRGALIKQQLIVLEDTVNGKELTGEVFLPGWAVESLLSGRRGDERGIDTDARLDFHNYLKDLDSSEDFFDQLDG